MDVTGDPEGEPQKIAGGPSRDIFHGLYGVIAIPRRPCASANRPARSAHYSTWRLLWTGLTAGWATQGHEY